MFREVTSPARGGTAIAGEVHTPQLPPLVVPSLPTLLLPESPEYAGRTGLGGANASGRPTNGKRFQARPPGVLCPPEASPTGPLACPCQAHCAGHSQRLQTCPQGASASLFFKAPRCPNELDHTSGFASCCWGTSCGNAALGLRAAVKSSLFGLRRRRREQYLRGLA